jgi:hypothetical protein
VNPVSWTELRQRALTLGLGTMLTAAGVWGALWVLMFVGIAAQPPDASVVDGDPCCPVPDSWTQVAGWSLLALCSVAVDAAALVLAGAFLSFAVRGRWPTGQILRVPLAAVAAGAGLIVLGLVVRGVL